MPIYTYRCEFCGEEVDLLARNLAEADIPRRHCEEDEHEICEGRLERQRVTRPTIGRPSFESGAVLGDGSVVKGHWGREAPKGKGWRRP